MNSDPLRYQNVGAALTTVVKTGSTRLYSLTCYNANAASRFIQVFDATVVPTTTVTVPLLSFLVPVGAQIIVGSDFFTEMGLPLSSGLVWAFSTTVAVYTAAMATDQQTAMFYV